MPLFAPPERFAVSSVKDTFLVPNVGVLEPLKNLFTETLPGENRVSSRVLDGDFAEILDRLDGVTGVLDCDPERELVGLA